MRVVVAGASGLLGSHLSEELVRRGHAVTALTRRPTSAPDESHWHPYAGEVDQSLIESADVVVNVAGASLLANPHSQKWAKQMRESRVRTTETLAGAIARATDDTGGHPAFLAGNGSSVYGDHGAEVVTEESDSRGDALLTRIARDWEAATEPARAAGARVCILRTAPVVTRKNPLFRLQVPLFKLGLGAWLGDGRQYFPLISLRDWVGATVHLAEHGDASGPFNMCAPETPTNHEYTKALAAAVSRPAFLFAPAPVLRLAGGMMAPEMLNSINLRPATLEESGYRFQDRDVSSVLATLLA